MIDVIGGLSLHLSDHLSHFKSNVQFYLIDRKNSRRKSDCRLKTLGFDCSRIFIDIKDLNLSKMLDPELDTAIFIGKHLCGAASCLALNAIANLARAQPQLFALWNHIVLFCRNITIVFATCCHQLCSWPCFRSRSLFDKLGLNASDFDFICKSSSWAVCQNKLPYALYL